MVRVGIPRALLYYRYYPMWRTFFEHLGAEVVLSAPTTRQTMVAGIARTVSETCLPVKVFCGHALALAGQCDLLFAPGIRSLDQHAYSCSKLLALPDLVRAVVPEAPPIIDTDIEVSKGKRALYLAIYSLGRRFTWNPLKIREASERAWETHQDYVRLTSTSSLSALEGISRMTGEPSPRQHKAPNGLNLALLGHPYVVYDDYVNHRLIDRLEAMGASILTPEMAPPEELHRCVAQALGRAYWTYEDEVTGAGLYYLDGRVDGVIAVVPFGCGPDSLMIDLVKRRARQRGGTPFMLLTIDEHTAEVGLVTRLEAFVDMILRRRRGAEGQG